MTTTPETTIVTRDLVPEQQRAAFVDALFGASFPTQFEPYVYAVTSELSSDYRGGYWHFYSLGNGGFYMAPDDDARFAVICPNGYQGQLSADALGVTVCLYAYSHLSFVTEGAIAETYARQYHLLREFMMEHPKVAVILEATD